MTTKARTTRSPNYPGIDLKDAVGRAQIIYSKEHHHFADKEVVAKDLGYSSLNGSSMAVLSALLKFGLLTQVKEQVKISDLALDILLSNPGDPSRVAALEKAASLPALFQELHTRFGGSLPSDDNIRNFLLRKEFNPNTVAGVIRAYRDTMTFVDEERSMSSAISGELFSQEGTMYDRKPIDIVRPTSTAPNSTPVPAARQESRPAGEARSFKIGENAEAEVLFRGSITQAAIRKLIAYLELSMELYPTTIKTEQQSEVDDIGANEGY